MNKQLAIVFPGQGSQSVGMLADVANEFSMLKDIFAEASEVLNYDLWELVQNGPEEKLNLTEYTQPALLVSGYALWCILQECFETEPSLLAGHSLGEYTALVCANALGFSQAVDLVATRGRYMQEAAPEGSGAIAAIIGLDEATVAEVCTEAAQNEVVTSANFNAIGQIVISGHKDAVDRAIALANKAGARRAILLPMSVPAHSSLMKPAAIRLAEKLITVNIKAPEIPVINNVDVAICANPTEIKNALVKQLDHSVRWVETIQTMAKQGIKTIIECGPGQVLAGLNRRIDRHIINVSVLKCLAQPADQAKQMLQEKLVLI